VVESGDLPPPQLSAAAPPTRKVLWNKAFRLIPSRYPAVGPWDRIADPADFEALAAVEGLTNPRLRAELGVLALIPRERRISGAGTTPIMAAFTHLNADGSRFSDGSYGVFYASRELETAIHETVFHRERFLARTREAPLSVQMRCYITAIRRSLHDLRVGYKHEHRPDSYAASQRLGRALRTANADGLVYRSVRHPGGECAALFWPDCVAPCTQGMHYNYHWDGHRIAQVTELRAVAL
jgi:hypothetical protein